MTDGSHAHSAAVREEREIPPGTRIITEHCDCGAFREAVVSFVNTNPATERFGGWRRQ